MNKITALVKRDSRPFGSSMLVRWLVLLVIALDLLSSPLHSHHHDAGTSGGTFHASAISSDHDHDQDGHVSDAVDHADEHGGSVGHQLAALLPDDSVSHADWQPLLFALLLVPGVALTPIETSQRFAWDTLREPIPSSTGRHWLPVGRAPPFFHG